MKVKQQETITVSHPLDHPETFTSGNIIAMGTQKEWGEKVTVEHVLCANAPPMTREQLANLSRNLEMFFNSRMRLYEKPQSSELIDRLEGQVARATDLVNTWARERGVKEAASTWDLVPTIDRVWSDTSSEWFRYKTALESIAANSCCDKCQEAKLVAKQALGIK